MLRISALSSGSSPSVAGASDCARTSVSSGFLASNESLACSHAILAFSSARSAGAGRGAQEPVHPAVGLGRPGVDLEAAGEVPLGLPAVLGVEGRVARELVEHGRGGRQRAGLDLGLHPLEHEQPGR